MNMNKALIVSLIVCAIAVVSLFSSFVLYLWEPQQFRWHVRHGFHTEAIGVKFPIPLHYYVADLPDGTTIIDGHVRNFSKDPAQLHSASIFISEDPSDSKDVLVDVLNSKAYLVRMGARTASLTGSQGECFEYEGPPLRDSSNHVYGAKRIEIACNFHGGMRISFIGTPLAVPDFYHILGSAEKGSAQKIGSAR